MTSPNGQVAQQQPFNIDPMMLVEAWKQRANALHEENVQLYAAWQTAVQQTTAAQQQVTDLRGELEARPSQDAT